MDATHDQTPHADDAAPLDDDALQRKDRAYSPSSDREAAQRQAQPDESRATDDPEIDDDAVDVLPGTGGPDDVGTVEPDDADIRMPRRREAR
jgi:hypothetical protein